MALVLGMAGFTRASAGDHLLTLMQLPYAENALEPYISGETIRYHHGKHLAAYVANTNRLKAGTEFDAMPLDEIIRKSDGALFNNAAQIDNHRLYFEELQPYAPGNDQPCGKIKTLLEEHFGSFNAFQKSFSETAAGFFGSGWVWLVADKGGKLEIITTGNADTPVREGKTPVLALDVWEHSYYLDTRNDRKRYIENFWKVVNWGEVNRRTEEIVQ